MIEINVRAPKRCKGQYEFVSFYELVRWINMNFRRPKGLAAEIIMLLAQNGTYSAYTGTYSLDCSYDKPIGDEAAGRAREIGFLKKDRGLGSDGGLNLRKLNDYVRALEEANP